MYGGSRTSLDVFGCCDNQLFLISSCWETILPNAHMITFENINFECFKKAKKNCRCSHHMNVLLIKISGPNSKYTSRKQKRQI